MLSDVVKASRNMHFDGYFTSLFGSDYISILSTELIEPMHGMSSPYIFLLNLFVKSATSSDDTNSSADSTVTLSLLRGGFFPSASFNASLSPAIMLL